MSESDCVVGAEDNLADDTDQATLETRIICGYTDQDY